jgi:hypothetical protein
MVAETEPMSWVIAEMSDVCGLLIIRTRCYTKISCELDINFGLEIFRFELISAKFW